LKHYFNGVYLSSGSTESIFQLPIEARMPIFSFIPDGYVVTTAISGTLASRPDLHSEIVLQSCFFITH
jgi:hypothetical protein